jgi:tripartite-type tricarboxylate transporter receptor subunit TctC
MSWFGMLAPTGTPAAVLQRLEAELQKAMATPAIKERVATMGAMPGVHHAIGFSRVIEAETQRWANKPGAAAAAPATTIATISAQKP